MASLTAEEGLGPTMKKTKKESKKKMLKRHEHTLRTLEQRKNKECKKCKDKVKRSEIAAKYRAEIKRVSEEQAAELAARDEEERGLPAKEAGSSGVEDVDGVGSREVDGSTDDAATGKYSAAAAADSAADAKKAAIEAKRAKSEW